MKHQEFLTLKLEDMTMDEYAWKFNELKVFCPIIILTEDALVEQL